MVHGLAKCPLQVRSSTGVRAQDLVGFGALRHVPLGLSAGEHTNSQHSPPIAHFAHQAPILGECPTVARVWLVNQRAAWAAASSCRLPRPSFSFPLPPREIRGSSAAVDVDGDASGSNSPNHSRAIFGRTSGKTPPSPIAVRSWRALGNTPNLASSPLSRARPPLWEEREYVQLTHQANQFRFSMLIPRNGPPRPGLAWGV